MKFWSQIAMILTALAAMASCDHLHNIDDNVAKMVTQGEHR